MNVFSGAKWDGNSISSEIDDKIIIFITNNVCYTINNGDKIIKITSNNGNIFFPYAVAHGERKGYFMSNELVVVPNEDIEFGDDDH